MLTPQQCRAARGGLDWTRAELAERAGVSLSTVASFEQEKRGTYRPNLDAMRRALEEGGVQFTEEGCVCFPERPENSKA